MPPRHVRGARSPRPMQRSPWPRALRAPERHTHTIRRFIGSVNRAPSSSPSGIHCAFGAWPASHSSALRTSSSTCCADAALGVDRAHFGDLVAVEHAHVAHLASTRRGDLAQALVVGLAGRGALERVDDDDLLRHLVRGERRAAVRARARRRRSCARRCGCTSATTISPQRSSGTPTTTQSNTSGCDAQRELDLFGVDLLAAGVDARRAAAEQADRAVGLDASRSRRGSSSAGRRPCGTSRRSSRDPCSSRAGSRRRRRACRSRSSPGCTSSPSSVTTTTRSLGLEPRGRDRRRPRASRCAS